MRLVRLKAPGGLENLKLVEEDHFEPRPGELLVRIRASSLNFHDNMVALGKKPCADGRIPLSDGAGEVIALGDDVRDFTVGDAVVSTYWPYWLGGEPTPAAKAGELGDDFDGYAREYVTVPAQYFTKTPPGYSHAEAATLPCAALTAWRGLVTAGQVKQGDFVLVQGSGGVSVFALQFAKAADRPIVAMENFGSTQPLAKAITDLADEVSAWNERNLIDALIRQARHQETTRWDTIEFKLDD